MEPTDTFELIERDIMIYENHRKIFTLDIKNITNITRSDVNKGHPEYYQDMAKRIAEETGNSFYINQFENHANPLAHETTTGPEIFRQLEGKINAIVCGIGSSGTLTGLTHYFKRVKPDVEMIISDPAGSVIKDYITNGSYNEAGSWLVEGIGEDFIPPIAGALKYCRKQTVSKNVVTFVCDTGNKYLTKMFNDAWLKEKGINI